MSKILITGGLGYIGTALTNLYLNNLEDDITIIDKKRDPLRENQFQNNNIEFIEIDILNKKELRKSDKVKRIVNFESCEANQDVVKKRKL